MARSFVEAAFLATLTLTWAAMEVIAYRSREGEGGGTKDFFCGRNIYEGGVLYAVKEAKRNRLGHGRSMGWISSDGITRGLQRLRSDRPQTF